LIDSGPRMLFARRIVKIFSPVKMSALHATMMTVCDAHAKYFPIPAVYV